MALLKPAEREWLMEARHCVYGGLSVLVPVLIIAALAFGFTNN